MMAIMMVPGRERNSLGVHIAIHHDEFCLPSTIQKSAPNLISENIKRLIKKLRESFNHHITPSITKLAKIEQLSPNQSRHPNVQNTCSREHCNRRYLMLEIVRRLANREICT